VRSIPKWLVLLLMLVLAVPLVGAGCYGRVGLDPRDDDDNADDDDSGDDDDNDDDDAGDDDVQDDDDGSGDFSIDEIDPDHGSTDGGYTAEIFYEGDSLSDLDEDEVEVRFDEAEAEVLAITDSKLLVTVPPGCVPGDVDVTVELPDGTDDDVDFEFEPAGEGLDGAVFGVYRSEVPAYPGNESGAVEIGFFEPTASPPLGHLPPLGNCSYNIVPPVSDRDYYSVGPSVTISAGVPIVATLDPSSTTYTAGGTAASTVPNGASYSIYDVDDPDGCALTFPTVVSSPPSLQLTSPDITSQKFADCWFIADGYGVVEWVGPYSSADYAFVTISHAEDPSGASLTCHVQDNGLVLLDEADMIGLTPGLHQLSVTRYRVTETEHPRDSSTAYGVFADTRSGFVFVMLWPEECGF
jgi:hypothetical protein